jgi:4-diphosphocytidyl-2-C-methyl-D-erythritol kinase
MAGGGRSAIARAKINLTLQVLGRRPDGYHEIESLVAFADIGDRLTMKLRGTEPNGSPAEPASLRVVGPFAEAICGDNLVDTAIRQVEAAAGAPLAADFLLEKRLPVASGVGGGSADAAAALRLMQDAYGASASRIDWEGIGRGLGADVPVCLAGRPAVMSGTGERIRPIGLPRLDIVLANACETVPADKTRRVFAALRAPPVAAVAAKIWPAALDRAQLLAIMQATGNDLEAPSRGVIASLGVVKDAVAATAGCEIAIVSGAGPTIVGIHASAEAAERATRALRQAQPRWWVQSGTLGGD